MTALVLLFAPAAPAPPYRPLTGRALVGSWNMRLGLSRYRVVLAADGSWACRGPSNRYVGRWRVEGERLVIDEQTCYPDGQPGERFTWSASLHPRTLEGTTDSFGVLVLWREK